MSTPRRFVRLFKPRFARLVVDGTKGQTMRPTPKRMPRPCDILDCRMWEGLPYRSKQRRLGEATITLVQPSLLVATSRSLLLTIGKHTLFIDECAEFAKADGFENFAEMVDWFEAEHGLPFSGIVIYWDANKFKKAHHTLNDLGDTHGMNRPWEL